jgi:hypothetical protein
MITKNLLAGALLLTVGLSSCVTKEYYETTPAPPPSGYVNRFDDDFDYDAHNWSFIDRANTASVSVSGGTLAYNYHPANDGTNTVAIATGANLKRDFLVQTRIKADYAMGLVFGVSNTDYGYSLMIDNEGYYALYDEGDADHAVNTILDWEYSPALKTAGWNDIEFEQVDGYWAAYANGEKLFEIKAKPIYGNKTGYIVMAGTTGYADYMTVKW